jgi:hypothetical protein
MEILPKVDELSPPIEIQTEATTDSAEIQPEATASDALTLFLTDFESTYNTIRSAQPGLSEAIVFTYVFGKSFGDLENDLVESFINELKNIPIISKSNFYSFRQSFISSYSEEIQDRINIIDTGFNVSKLTMLIYAWRTNCFSKLGNIHSRRQAFNVIGPVQKWTQNHLSNLYISQILKGFFASYISASGTTSVSETVKEASLLFNSLQYLKNTELDIRTPGTASDIMENVFGTTEFNFGDTIINTIEIISEMGPFKSRINKSPSLVLENLLEISTMLNFVTIQNVRIYLQTIFNSNKKFINYDKIYDLFNNLSNINNYNNQHVVLSNAIFNTFASFRLNEFLTREFITELGKYIPVGISPPVLISLVDEWINIAKTPGSLAFFQDFLVFSQSYNKVDISVISIISQVLFAIKNNYDDGTANKYNYIKMSYNNILTTPGIETYPLTKLFFTRGLYILNAQAATADDMTLVKLLAHVLGNSLQLVNVSFTCFGIDN